MKVATVQVKRCLWNYSDLESSISMIESISNIITGASYYRETSIGNWFYNAILPFRPTNDYFPAFIHTAISSETRWVGNFQTKGNIFNS